MPLQPYANMMVGQPKRYLGRKFDPKSKEYRISAPYECEDGSPEAERCKLFVRREDAVPADAATAKVCGVKFDEPAPKQSGRKKSADSSEASA